MPDTGPLNPAQLPSRVDIHGPKLLHLGVLAHLTWSCLRVLEGKDDLNAIRSSTVASTTHTCGRTRMSATRTSPGTHMCLHMCTLSHTDQWHRSLCDKHRHSQASCCSPRAGACFPSLTPSSSYAVFSNTRSQRYRRHGFC